MACSGVGVRKNRSLLAERANSQPAAPDVVLCSDWSKSAAKRSVWVADIPRRSISPLAPPESGWNVEEVVNAAEEQAGRTLITFDAPLGVPRSYLDAARGVFRDVRTFLDLIEAVSSVESFYEPVVDPGEWRPETPFFKVAPGMGGYDRFRFAAANARVELKRLVEQRTRGNSVFAFGLPGQVAPAAQALWRELGTARKRGAGFTVWPFEPRSTSNQVAEIYPRAAYGTALRQIGVPLSLAKTNAKVRANAIEALADVSWVKDANVELRGAEQARENEDDFDACLTAAALLRLLLSEQPLADGRLVDHDAEGAILAARAEALST